MQTWSQSCSLGFFGVWFGLISDGVPRAEMFWTHDKVLMWFFFLTESQARPPFEGGPPPHLPPFERHGPGFPTAILVQGMARLSNTNVPSAEHRGCTVRRSPLVFRGSRGSGSAKFDGCRHLFSSCLFCYVLLTSKAGSVGFGLKQACALCRKHIGPPLRP